MIEILKNRYIDFLMNNPVEMLTDYPLDSVSKLLEKMDGEGKFIDIDYGDDHECNDFAADHCIRLQNMAWTYRKYEDKQFLQSLNKGLKWWTDHNYRGNNWYINLVTVPRTLGQILLLIGEEIELDIEIELALRVRKTLEADRHSHDIGANTMMLGMNTYIYALYKKDESLLERCRLRISEEMTFADDHKKSELKWRGDHWKSYVKVDFDKPIYEGVQRDFSFFEHGPMLYTGGYGKIYFTHIAHLIYMTKGTGFFTNKSIEFIVDFTLDHLRWTLYNDGFDYNVSGRNILNENDASHMPNPVLMSSRSVVNMIGKLTMAVEDYRIPELEELLLNIKAKTINGKLSGSMVIGNRYFPIGSYISHHTDKYFTSVRMSSKDVIGAECVNWENISGWHQGDGIQYIHTHGHEYEGIFPAWNWKMLPGLTAVHKPMPPLDHAQSIHFKGSHSSYCGGVSSGKVGIAAMELDREHLKAQKTWFMFEDECVCLGVGITTDVNYKVTTTLNQSLLRGDVTSSCGNIAYGSDDINDYEWVYHDGVGYIAGQGQKLRVTAKGQSGNRHDVNRSHKPVKPSEPDIVTKDIVSIWMDHGIKASNQTYAYTIVPGIEGGRPVSKSEIIVNKPELQVVICGQVLMLVFWQAGSYDDGEQIYSSDQPCVMIVKGYRKVRPMNKEAAGSIIVIKAELERG